MTYKLVSLDFDHTLTRGVTAAEHLASLLGIQEIIARAEAALKSGELDTYGFTNCTAHFLTGIDVSCVLKHMRKIPLIGGVRRLISALKAQGLRVILNTIGYRSILTGIAEELEIDAVSGVEFEIRDARFTGKVISYFPLEEKITFARDHVARAGGTLSNVIAIGDGASDRPLFQAVGTSIAFNADEATEKLASLAVRGEDCRPLLRRLNQILKGKTPCPPLPKRQVPQSPPGLCPPSVL